MALTWDDVSALVNRGVKAEVTNAWKDKHVLAHRLTKEGKKKPVSQAYGDGVRFPITYQASGNVKWYTKGTVLPAATTPQISAAQFDYKYVTCQAAVDGTERLRVSGKNAGVDLVKTITANSLDSLWDSLGTEFYNDGSDSLKINGIRDLMASATYGGVATADFAGWATTTYSTTNTLTTDLLDRVFTDAADGDDYPTMGITRPSVLSKLRSILTPQERYQEDSEMRKYGFRNLMFLGTPVFADRYAPGGDWGTTTNQFFWLNENYLEVFIHPDRNFEIDDPIRPTNQDARIYPILVAMNMGCSRRDRHSRFSVINPSL